MSDETPPLLDPASNNGHGHAANGRFAPRNSIGHRFGPGNTYGKGNPVTRRIHELRREAVAGETPERPRAVLEKLHELALAGDVAAARLYLDTVIGKAPTAVELSGPDGGPLGRGLDLSCLTDDELRSLEGIAGKLAGSESPDVPPPIRRHRYAPF